MTNPGPALRFVAAACLASTRVLGGAAPHRRAGARVTASWRAWMGAAALAVGLLVWVVADELLHPPVRTGAVVSTLSLAVALVVTVLAAGARDRRSATSGERAIAATGGGEETLRNILDQLPFGIAVAEVATGEIVIVNREARRVLGEGSIGQGGPSYPLARALLHRERVEGELHVVERPEGGSTTLEVSAAPVFDAAGRPILAISAFQDVSARLRAENDLRQAQKMEALGLLTGGIAHDTNNLLTAILGNLELLERRLGDETSRTLLRNAVGATERGARLTAQLLGFSRRRTLAAVAVDVNATVSSMAGLLQSTLGGSVALELALDPGSWTVLADPTQIELVLLNLALNARDAMPAGGRITVRTENLRLAQRTEPNDPEPGDYAMLTVCDEGAGMDEATRARAFEPFFSTKAPGRGSGLGLSQVLGITQLLGGGVRIRSQPGQGTSVMLLLPRSAAAAEAARPEPGGGVPEAFRGRRILLVDDDRDVRIAARALLAQLGFQVAEEANGAAAVARIADGLRVDAVLMDYAMPGINGAEAARQMRAMRPDLPILLITGYAEPHALPGIEGRFPVLPKPFRTAALSSGLSAILAAAPDGADRGLADPAAAAASGIRV